MIVHNTLAFHVQFVYKAGITVAIEDASKSCFSILLLRFLCRLLLIISAYINSNFSPTDVYYLILE